ncbi:MAG TPA: response regulator [Flavobacterium sp.]|jgi:DNA-binding NarL/FixJ family response regulator
MRKLLIVDDHPAMIEGYKSILSLNQDGDFFEISIAHDCASAYRIIVQQGACFEMALLDVILPPSDDFKISSGLDLARLIRKNHPLCKLVFLTSHTEAFVLYTIVKEVQPEGLLVKSDFTAEEFLEALTAIDKDETYRSATVTKGIQEILRKDTYLDTYNRQIISLLAQGVKTKNLPRYLNLSISAIDKRKVQIKDYFGIEKGGDEDILTAAKKSGFI